MPKASNCYVCGTKVTGQGRTRYCSSDCSRTARLERSRGGNAPVTVPTLGKTAPFMCGQCGETFYVYPSAKTPVYCSWECRTAEPRRHRLSERISWACKGCGLVEMRQPSEAHKPFCTTDCYNAWRRATHPRRAAKPRNCEVCGTEIYAPPSVGNRKKFCSRRCLAIGQPARRTSKQADAAIAVLLERHPEWNTSAEHNVGRWRIDLALPEWQIAIELDGIYWHSLPNVVKKDRAKDRHLRRNGWQVVRVTMNKESPSQVADMVDDALASLGLLVA